MSKDKKQTIEDKIEEIIKNTLIIIEDIKEGERKGIFDEIKKTIIKRKQGCLIDDDNIGVFNKDTVSWKELRKICGEDK